jgi:NADH-quinone oxidoreductase subunit L
MGRVTWKTFLGKPRWTEHYVKHHHHPHESSKAMTMPLLVLAALAIVGGFMLYTPVWLGHNEALPNWLGASLGMADGHGEADAHGAAEAPHHEPFVLLGTVTATEIAFALISVVLSALMLLFALNLYTKRYGATDEYRRNLKGLYAFSLNKWYVDEFYNSAIVRPGVWLAYAFWRVFDVKIIDGIVNGTAWFIGALGQIIRPLQTGFVRNYALYLLLGAVLFMLYNIWR